MAKALSIKCPCGCGTLMPWQTLVAEVASEFVRDDETGFWVPAYPEVGVTVPRQSGKTTIYLCWISDRLFVFQSFDGAPQKVAYTAQDGASARKKFKEDLWPRVERSPFAAGVGKPRFSAEDTGLTLTNGGVWSVLSSAASAGHGFSWDLDAKDELFKDVDARRDGATSPGMATRHDSQSLWCSTAGDEKSVMLAMQVAAGREAVLAGKTRDYAYFEWSAEDTDDLDPEDPRVWWSCMPALGHTITEATVRKALEKSRKTDPSLAEFKRAWLNISKGTASTEPIPEAVFAAVCDPQAKPGAGVTFAADGNKRGDDAAISVCDGRGVIELIEQRDGSQEWLRARAKELARRHRAAVAIDVGGPVGYLAGELEDDGVDVVRMGTREVCHAAQAFKAAVADRRCTVRTDPRLSASVKGAAVRAVGESWTWSRTTIAASSPIMSASMAFVASGSADDPMSNIW